MRSGEQEASRPDEWGKDFDKWGKVEKSREKLGKVANSGEK